MAETKIIDQSLMVSRKRGNGTLRYEVWHENGIITRYNLAYINHLIFSGDNGRVIGYDNRHGHHRHFKGTVEPVEMTTFEEIEQSFEQEWIMVLEEYNAQRNR
ncbi:MAG: transcriptional regulator [Geobacteraceae bacterium]|nr:transcriptional regulator [Geobacteraceae bacterium]